MLLTNNQIISEIISHITKKLILIEFLAIFVSEINKPKTKVTNFLFYFAECKFRVHCVEFNFLKTYNSFTLALTHTL